MIFVLLHEIINALQKIYNSRFFISSVQDAQLNAASPILRLTRSGETAWGPLPGGDWTIFQANHSTYEPLAWAHRDSLDYPTNKSPLATVIQVYTDFFLLC